MKMTVNWGCLGALFLTACSGGDPVEIGNDEITGEKLADYAASWDGYIEGANFNGGWDRIRFRLDGSGTGILHFGEGEPYALEPGELPPPSESEPSQHLDSFESQSLRLDLEYPVSATVEQKRLKLTLNRGQVYDEFCRTLVYEVGGLGCIDYSAYVVPGADCELYCVDTTWPVDCAVAEASRTCVCHSEGCEGPLPIDLLDGALSNNGRELEGTLRLHSASETSYVVRLRRTK